MPDIERWSEREKKNTHSCRTCSGWTIKDRIRNVLDWLWIHVSLFHVGEQILPLPFTSHFGVTEMNASQKLKIHL